MARCLIGVVAAGALGVFANAAEDGPAYVLRLSVLFLGAAVLGWAGPALFVWRKAKEGRRILYLLLGILAARIAYVPSLELSVLLAGWTERLGRALGAERLGAPVHYALGCFHAAFVCLASLVLLSAAANARHATSIAVFVLYAAASVLAFSSSEDRAILPQSLSTDDIQPAAEGEDYLDVAEDVNRRARTRVLAALYGIVDAVAPRSGWAAAVRVEMHARFRADPDMSLRARVTSIEGALRTALPLFRISPRTPPG